MTDKSSDMAKTYRSAGLILGLVFVLTRRPVIALLRFVLRLALISVRPTLLTLGATKAIQLITQKLESAENKSVVL